MVRHTSTVVSVPSQADTQLSPMGVAWNTNALIASSLRMGSQEPSMRHGPIVLCCPGNGPQTPSLQEQKGETGGRETRTRVKPSTRVFRPTPIAPKTQNPRPHPRRPGTGPTSAPTSAARPLICYSEFLERSLLAFWTEVLDCLHGRRKSTGQRNVTAEPEKIIYGGAWFRFLGYMGGEHTRLT